MSDFKTALEAYKNYRWSPNKPSIPENIRNQAREVKVLDKLLNRVKLVAKRENIILKLEHFSTLSSAEQRKTSR